MSRHITTRAQVSGYRFGRSRAEHALVRRDVTMMHDPMRAQMRSMIAGAVLAVLIVAGAGIYGFIRPQPRVDDAQIVASDDGALHVLIDDAMHPVSDVASARLILGSPAPVRRVSDRSLATFPRGPQVGIIGAPARLASPSDRDRSTWTVCDSPDGGAVIVGGLARADGRSRDALLVEEAGTRWLIYPDPRPDGGGAPVRARVDDSRVELGAALGLGDHAARPIWSGLLNSFPIRPDLRIPEVPGRGGPGALGLTVGTVVASSSVDRTVRYHLILADAVQPISPAAAEVMRLVDPSAAGEVRRVAPGALATTPVREAVPLAHFPTRVPRLVDAETPVLCHRWTRERDAAVSVAELVTARRLPIAQGSAPVRLASSDGPGPALDLVQMRPGSGEHVMLTGIDTDSRRASTPMYVSDAGVRYRLAGPDVATILGLDEPLRAPWPVVSLLPSGPELSREAAAVTRDGIG